MSTPPLLIIVLAAGKGTRMKSALPKVLHKIAGRSMMAHVLALAGSAAADSLAVVVGPGMTDVEAEAKRVVPTAKIFVQHEQRGTADAVLAARAAIEGHRGDVLVLYADTPLIQPETIKRLRSDLGRGASIAVLGFRAKDPLGYGRLLTEANGTLIAIREDKDANTEERKINLCNSGVLAFRVPNLASLLDKVGNANAKGEYYLTDAVEIARWQNLKSAVVECPETEVLGVNARDQLASAEAIWQARARAAMMRDGVTMIAPETVWLSFDTVIGRDVKIEPNVFFGPSVRIGDNAEIRANCHIEGATIAKGARVGPLRA